MSEPELSRRQLRAREEQASVPETLPTRKQLRELERSQIGAEVAEDEYLTPTGPIGLVPETKSLVVEQVRDVTNTLIPVPDSGVSVMTGSITLPVLPVAGTGEIKTIELGDAADDAALQERYDSQTTGITPMAAPMRRGSRKRNRVFTQNLRAGQGQIYWILGSLVVMLAFAGMYIFALLTGLV